MRQEVCIYEENGFINYKINTRFGEFNIPLSSDREFKVLIDLLNKLQKGIKDTEDGNVCSVKDAFLEVEKILSKQNRN